MSTSNLSYEALLVISFHQWNSFRIGESKYSPNYIEECCRVDILGAVVGTMQVGGSAGMPGRAKKIPVEHF